MLITFSDRDPLFIQKLNELAKRVDQQGKLSVGPGLRAASGPGGVSIGLVNKDASIQKATTSDPTGGTLLELDSTQGTQDTDTYSRDSDDCPVSVQVLTDVQYDSSTHKLTARLRTMTFNRAGRLDSISAEGSLVEITTAVQCTGTP